MLRTINMRPGKSPGVGILADALRDLLFSFIQVSLIYFIKKDDCSGKSTKIKEIKFLEQRFGKGFSVEF
jgi:hypothetical protein